MKHFVHFSQLFLGKERGGMGASSLDLYSLYFLWTEEDIAFWYAKGTQEYGMDYAPRMDYIQTKEPNIFLLRSKQASIAAEYKLLPYFAIFYISEPSAYQRHPCMNVYINAK